MDLRAIFKEVSREWVKSKYCGPGLNKSDFFSVGYKMALGIQDENVFL
jgi:hypothetical protein